MVPQPGEQALPFCRSVQATPLLPESWLTVAVKAMVSPWSTVCAPVGERLKPIGGVAPDPLLHPLRPTIKTTVNTATIQELLRIRLITPPFGCGGQLEGASETP